MSCPKSAYSFLAATGSSQRKWVRRAPRMPRGRPQTHERGKTASSLATRSGALPDALAKGTHVGADTSCVHSIVTDPLAAGGAHVDAASCLVAGDPDDDIVGEPEPTALFAGLNAPLLGIDGDDRPARH